MKKTIQTILFLMVLLLALIIVPNVSKAATTHTVATESDLKEKISTAEEGDIIKLTADIKLKDPIEITGKKITIDGDNHTITRDTETWVTGRVSASLITVGGAGTKVTLTNLKLTNSEKYGAQAYNGGYLVLNKVTIGGCAYGGVLVNGGILEVIDLTLNKNNDLENNGIEIGKASNINATPKVIMNGKITSTESDNVIYIATNDAMTDFEVENTDESEYKIYASGDKVVIADKNNTVLFESNSNPKVEIAAEEYKENTSVKLEPEKQKDTTPKTGVEDKIEIAIPMLIISIIGLALLKKKKF